MNHGTTTAYKLGCRCDACAAEHYRYRKGYALRARERKQGRRAVITNPQTVAPDEAIRHLWALVESGWTMTAIAEEAGMGRNHLWNIRAGKFTRLRVVTADRILAVDPLEPDDAPDPVVVDRLVAGGDWRAMGATRAERIAAAEKAWAMWGPIRAAETAQGTASFDLPGESLTDLERRLSLRAGRDFKRRAAAA